MSALFLSLVTFACPQQHASSDSKEVVRLTMGLVATTVVLVLGLLVASAKGFYDTQNNEVTQLAASVVMLDRVLAHYGPEATDTRASLRASIEHWAEVLQPGSGRRHGEVVLDQIQALSPKDDNQRSHEGAGFRSSNSEL